MTDFVFPAPAPTTLPVQNRNALFPIARVFCIGRNYRWTDDEPIPTEMPSWFMKPATAVILANGRLPYPPETQSFYPEIEWVVAIGKGGRNIDPTTVQSQHIWGYAAGLDMTRRDLQLQAKHVGGPWEPAKAFDYSAPCTPIVPTSVCGHPQEGTIWLAVNGIERQRADVSDLLWSVPELVAMLSRSVELMPGDLIYTGTPVGVDAVQPGDLITAGVMGFGEISMTVSAAKT